MSMVKDAERFGRKLRKMPPAVEAELRKAMPRQADRIVTVMKAFAPGFIKPHIAWTWGDAPSGAVRLATYAPLRDSVRITIYANPATSEYPQGFPAVAAWFEFGTADRYTKAGKYSGRIAAQPFFYPGFRMYRKPAAAAIKRAMRKGIREAIR